MRASARAAALLAAASCLAGCSELADYAALASANRLHGRGDYQGAVAAYLSVDSAAFPATAAYDLANAYARLGEHRAAGELYAESRRADAPDRSPALAAAALVNEGLSLYERGSFEEAWRSFRAALSAGSGEGNLERDARYDLELAWRAWRLKEVAAPRGAAPTAVSPGGSREAELRILERMETGTWRPGTGGGTAGGPDY